MHKRKINLLLIEDDTESGISMKMMLAKRGLDVTLCTSGEDALKAFNNESFDVIVSDIRLQGISGVDVLHAIREMDPVFPFILLTGYDSIETAIDALQHGAQDYILKPLEDIDQLIKPVRAAVENHRIRLQQVILEKQLADSERRFRKIYENAAVGVCLLDTEGKLTECNKRFRQMLCIKELDDIEPFRLVPHLVNEKHESTLAHAIKKLQDEKHDNVLFETELKYRNIHRWVSIAVSLFNDDSEPASRILAIIHDITERKEMEARLAKHQQGLFEAEKMVAVGKLASGIAHDFNNILYIINGNVRMALNHLPKDHPDRERLLNALAAGETATDLLDRLRTSSQPAAGKKPIHFQHIAKQTLDILAIRLPVGVSCSMELEAPKYYVLGEHVEIQQIVMNLFMNAIQAMEASGGTLRIKLYPVSDKTIHSELLDETISVPALCFAVHDSGKGIPSTDLRKIFEPYFSTRHTEGGTGLGLSLVYGIIKAHGGTIDVHSVVGKGSSFYVYLPIIQNTLPLPPSPPVSANTYSERILLIDDDPQALQITKEIIARQGYKAQVFTDPLEAVEALRNNPDSVDLAIIDLAMPQMTGGQLSIELLNIRPDLPIIVLTAFTRSIQADGFFQESKISKYLNKAVSPTELTTSIRQILDQTGRDSHTKRTILVIDDDSATRKLLRDLLEDASYRVIEAANGQQGIDKFLSHNIDLVLTDMFMPEKDGLEVLQECRKINTGTKVFVFTGGGRNGCWDSLPLAAALGADQTFYHPLDHQFLLDRIYETLFLNEPA